jgi:hypothetical protein
MVHQPLHQQPAVHTEELISDKAKYPSPLTGRDISTINSTKWSSVRSGHIEQRLFIQISRRDGLQCRQIHFKLLEVDGDEALSYVEVCDWSGQFLMGRKYVEDARRTGRSRDFSVQLRIQSAVEQMPRASVRWIAEATHTPATTVFYI